MSLYDKASLVMIPSGYKASSATLYSVVPNTSVGDFDVTVDADATRLNKDGLIESVSANQARLDYPLTDGVVGDCPHLLLEPSRTNLLSYSEDFSQSTQWLISSMTVTTDDAVAPNGSQTADKIQATGAGSIRTNNSYTVTSGYSFSIFVKKGNSRYVTLRSFAFTTSAIIGFDLDTETAQTGGVIEKYPNDWYRLSISKDVSSDADKNGFFYIYLPNSLGSASTVSGNYAYFFGAQLEDADYPTSYIPVLGLSSVTRSADVCNSAGDSSTFNDSEGVLFLEFQGLTTTDAENGYVSISDGTATNSVLINTRTSGSLRLYNGGVGSTNLIYIETVDYSNTLKIALQYGTTTGSYKVYINGTSKTISGTFSATAISGLDELKFQYALGGNNFYGKVKQIMVFNEALTDSELEQLTS